MSREDLEGRRVWQSRRAEWLGPLVRRSLDEGGSSFSPVPKGGASLRATLAAVGSVKAAPLPALWRSFFARGREWSILGIFIQVFLMIIQKKT